MVDNRLDPSLPVSEVNERLLRMPEGSVSMNNVGNTEDNAFLQKNSALGGVGQVDVIRGVQVPASVPISDNASIYECGSNVLIKTLLDILGFRVIPTSGFNLVSGETIRAHDFDYFSLINVEWQNDETETLSGNEFSYEFTVPIGVEKVNRAFKIKTDAGGAVGSVLVFDIECFNSGKWLLIDRATIPFTPSTTISAGSGKFTCIEPTGGIAKPTKYRFRVFTRDEDVIELKGNLAGEMWVNSNAYPAQKFTLARRVEIESPLVLGRSPLLPAGNYFSMTGGVVMSPTKGFRNNYEDLVITSIHIDQNTATGADVELLVNGVVVHTVSMIGIQSQEQVEIELPKTEIMSMRSKTGSGVMQNPSVIINFRKVEV